MVYKQKNPLAPTFIALAVVVGGACALVVSATGSSSSFVAATGAMVTGDSNLAVTSMGSAAAGGVGVLDPQEATLLANIRQIQNINLDSSILSDSSFVSFTDFIHFVAAPAGRPNPFATFAGLVASSSNSSAVGK